MLLDPFRLPYKDVSFFTKIKRFFYTVKKVDGAGCLVVHKSKLLLIHRGPPWNDWSFPKGVVENNNPKQEALRETWEEVGLKVKIIKKLPENNYAFYSDNIREKTYRTIHYYLASSRTSTFSFAHNPDMDESKSFIEAKWMTFTEAEAAVKHDTEKRIIRLASK